MKRASFWRISILIFLMLAVSNIAFANSVEEIVKNFRKKYEEITNFNADFEQTTFVAGRKRIAKGKLIFQKPNQLWQKYIDPANPENVTQLIVSDGQTLWSYTPLINQATKQELLQDDGNSELLPGFGQSLENIEKNYSLSLVKDEVAEKSDVQAVELIPKEQGEGSGAMFDTLQVWMRNKDSLPVQFMYKQNKNQMTFILSFKDIKINEKLDESIFKFEPPKGVQVITVPNQ